MTWLMHPFLDAYFEGNKFTPELFSQEWPSTEPHFTTSVSPKPGIQHKEGNFEINSADNCPEQETF